MQQVLFIYLFCFSCYEGEREQLEDASVTVLMSYQAYPTFYEILIWMRVQLLLNIRRCAYGVCQWGPYMSCFIPDICFDAATLISSHNHI